MNTIDLRRALFLSRRPSTHSFFLVWLLGLLIWSGSGFAAEEPVYEPAPSWVAAAEIPTESASAGEEALSVLLWDQQFHLDSDGPSVYTRMAIRIDSPDGLMGLNTLSTEWSPLYETLIIHSVEIRRGQEILDVLSSGQRFSVFRRETNLELAILDGVLTAALQPEGLRVGDIVDFAFTITGADPALEGMAQGTIAVPQFSAQRVRLRASWIRSMDLRWRASGSLLSSAEERRNGRESVLEIELENPAPYVPANGVPARFVIEPHFEFSTYPTWQHVSSQMAPLYQRAARLPGGSSVQQEIDRILEAYDTPLQRANAALRMVQDEVRYLYVGLDFGGFVPVSAEETWKRRFGDCKGKSVLLLALLRGMGIDAEPVLVQSYAGDGLPDRLPMVGAFDHVIVRANIDDEEYWLDGTLPGGPFIGLIETPLYHWGLPVRQQGADLVEVRPAPLEVPETRLLIDLDFSTGVTAPGEVTGDLIFQGSTAEFVQQSLAIMDASDVEETLRAIWASYYPVANIASVQERYNPATGEFGVSMTGTVGSRWLGGRYESIVADLVFVQDAIGRPADQDQEAPYVVDYPMYVYVRETLILPQEGEGFRVEGADIDLTTMGLQMSRSSRSDGTAIVIEGSLRSFQSEVSAADVRAGGRRLAALGDRRLFVHAPTNYRVSPEEAEAALGPEPVSALDYIERGVKHLDNGRIPLAIADFTMAIELEPENSYGWANRGIAYVSRRESENARSDLRTAQSIDPNNPVVYRAYGMLAGNEGDYAEAIEQFTRSIELDPNSAFAYTMRARARTSISDYVGALEDSRTATRLNPAMVEPYFNRATVHGLNGRQEDAIAELEAMLMYAVVHPPIFREAAQLLARMGERESAMDAITKAFDVQPMVSDLLMRASLRDLGDDDGRRADLIAAFEMEPSSREARLRLARFHTDDGQPHDAIPLLDQLIGRDPNDLDAVSERGIAYALNGDMELAVLEFEVARAIAKNSADFNNMCWRKATLNVALEEALTDCLLAVEMEVNFANQDSLGLVYFRLGRFEEAIAAYDRALDIRATNAYSLFGRALAKRELGNQAGFDLDMDEALRLQPEIEEVFERYGIVP